MNKKLFGLVRLSIVLILVLSLVLTGCAPKATTPAASDSANSQGTVSGKINVLSSDDLPGFRKSVIPEFQKLYPGIEVNFMSMGYDALHQKEVTALEGG